MQVRPSVLAGNTRQKSYSWRILPEHRHCRGKKEIEESNKWGIQPQTRPATYERKPVGRSPVSHELCAAMQVDAPDAWFGGQLLYADFALQLCAHVAGPHNTKLGLVSLVLHIHDFPRLDPWTYALHYSARAADVLDPSQLHEGARIAIHSPDAHRQHGVHSRLATLIHNCGYCLKNL